MGFSLESTATGLSWLAAILLALGVIGKAVQLVWRTFKRISKGLDELLGDPNADPPIPRLTQRVAAVEAAQRKLTAELQKLNGPPNVRQARR
jgi:hypothetical protein